MGEALEARSTWLRRVITAALLATLAAGCGEDEPPAPAPAPAPDPAEADSPEAGEAAAAAYRAAMDAFNEGRRDDYLGAFREPFCGVAGAEVTRAALAEANPLVGAGLRVTTLHVIRARRDEVVLADHGLWYRALGDDVPADARPSVRASDEPLLQGTHAKLIVMRRAHGAWQIAAETPLGDRSCVEGALGPVDTPREHGACVTEHAIALRRCDLACGGEAPGSACNTCPDEALCALARCLGADLGDRCGGGGDGGDDDGGDDDDGDDDRASDEPAGDAPTAAPAADDGAEAPSAAE